MTPRSTNIFKLLRLIGFGVVQNDGNMLMNVSFRSILIPQPSGGNHPLIAPVQTSHFNWQWLLEPKKKQKGNQIHLRPHVFMIVSLARGFFEKPNLKMTRKGKHGLRRAR